MHPDTVASSSVDAPLVGVHDPGLPLPDPPLPVEDIDRTTALAAESEPAVKPAGSPDLWPFLKLPRRLRATFMRQVKPILDSSDMLNEVMRNAEERAAKDKAAGRELEASTDLDSAAQMFDLMADIEDVLRLAVPPADGADAAFSDWCLNASDDELFGLLSWYMETFQPGEAPASQS